MKALEPRWKLHLLDEARLIAEMSKDSTKVGSVLVDQEGSILLKAFNGLPRGVVDKQSRLDRPTKYIFAQHSERNLLNFAAKHGISTDGKIVITTHYPCAQCAGSLIQAGIRCVVVGDGVTHMDAVEFEAAAVMFGEAGVDVVRSEGND